MSIGSKLKTFFGKIAGFFTSGSAKSLLESTIDHLPEAITIVQTLAAILAGHNVGTELQGVVPFLQKAASSSYKEDIFSLLSLSNPAYSAEHKKEIAFQVGADALELFMKTKGVDTAVQSQARAAISLAFLNQKGESLGE